MSFDSAAYAIFLPAVFLLHWITPTQWRWAVLLIASYVFYAGFDPALSLLILGVTALSWGAGWIISRCRKQSARKGVLLLSLAALLGVLGWFKYFNFLGAAFSALGGVLGGAKQWEPMTILLPAGISFYTFQAMSYVIDIYRGSIQPEKHPGYYAVYISFFPQLVAGPIERSDRLIPQLRGERRINREDLRAGLRLLVSGFFRKLVVADLLAPFVEQVYKAPAPDGSAVAAATLLFALQIYCDFSGYSEIAAGSARLLGIRLMDNFDRPYLAGNIRDFWRRWHISLTNWFTDYVYIPLGGSRHGLKRRIFATFIVFALCGLWHGADWSFVVWGLLHGAYMLVWLLFTRARRDQATSIRRFAGGILTFAAVSFAWVFFRADNMTHAAMLIRQLFSSWNPEAGLALLMQGTLRGTTAWALGLLLIGLIAVLYRLPSAGEKQRTLPDMAWVLLVLAILGACFIRMDSGAANAFIYFQF